MATITRIPTEAEYLDRERRQLDKQLAAVESAPLAERQEAAKEYARALREWPDGIADHIGWIADGSYGRGASDRVQSWLADYRAAPKRKINSLKVNLCLMLAALDYSCPSRFAVNEWKKLSDEQKATLDTLLSAEIQRIAYPEDE